jgi:carbonic anhydrase
MSETTLLRRILEANKSFLAGAGRPLDASGEPFVVVACMDARLTGLLEPAMGLPRNRAFVVRTAGNRVSRTHSDVLRSIAAAFFTKGAREVFIVGHTDCAMAGFSAAQAAENFRKAGVARAAFGDEDLRTWFGAFVSVEANVRESVDALRRSGLVPAGGKVHGLIIDTAGGALQVIVDGDAEPASARAPEAEVARAPVEAAAPKPPPIPPVPPADRQAPAAARPMSYVDAVGQLREVIGKARRDKELRQAVSALADSVRRERDPALVFAALEELERKCAALHPELVPAVETLRGGVRTRKEGFDFIELMRRVVG